jgi:NADPH:quinone reductase
MRAIQISEFGGPEVLTPVEIPAPVPEPGQVLITVSRSGVNYADTHSADNSYLAPTTLPHVPGGEVVGTTADGRRVVALLTGSGGYAEQAVAPEALAFEIPESVDDVSALGLIVQGTTAWLLLRQSTHLEPGESVVVHAAAGGVGTLAVQLARSMGAGRVIATASSPSKRDLAVELGADVAIDPAVEDLAGALREANGGKRVDVVLEMTGGRVTDQSLRALAPLGRLAFYGMASREEPSPIELRNLLGHSSAVAGFWLPHAFGKPGLMQRAITELVTGVVDGTLRVIPGGDYPLSEARRAHEDLLARRTVGKLTLDPSR